jgi:hypothetical protein
MTGRLPGFGRENGGTALVSPVLDAPEEPELPRVTALPDEVVVDEPEYVAPVPRELPADPRSPLLTCDPPPLADDPPPLLLPRGTADVPLKPLLLPPLEDPALLPPEDPPDEPPDDPPEDPPDELLDEPPLPCECWADETVGVPSRNTGTSTASA